MNGGRGLGRCLDRGNESIADPELLLAVILTILHAFHVDRECCITKEPRRIIAFDDLMLKAAARNRLIVGIDTVTSNNARNSLRIRCSEEHLGRSIPLKAPRYRSPISKRNANSMPLSFAADGRRKWQLVGVTLIQADTVSSDNNRTTHRTPSSARINAPVSKKRSQVTTTIRGYLKRGTHFFLPITPRACVSEQGPHKKGMEHWVRQRQHSRISGTFLKNVEEQACLSGDKRGGVTRPAFKYRPIRTAQFAGCSHSKTWTH